MNPLSSVGTGELILILVIALIFLGPERLPEIARGVGTAIRRFRDALQDMSSDFGEDLASVQEVTQDLQEGIRAVQDVRHLSQTLVSSAAAPLVEAMEPVKSAVEEAKAAVDTGAPLTSSQAGLADSNETTSPSESKLVAKSEPEEADELPSPVDEVKEAAPLTSSQAGSADSDEVTLPSEPESVAEPKPPEEEESHSPDEPRVVVEDDQV
jgi:sec-independent protein translocase protein TatB